MRREKWRREVVRIDNEQVERRKKNHKHNMCLVLCLCTWTCVVRVYCTRMILIDTNWKIQITVCRYLSVLLLMKTLSWLVVWVCRCVQVHLSESNASSNKQKNFKFSSKVLCLVPVWHSLFRYFSLYFSPAVYWGNHKHQPHRWLSRCVCVCMWGGGCMGTHFLYR